MATKKVKNKKITINRIIIIAMAAFTIYVVVSIFMTQQDIDAKTQQLETLNNKIAEQQVMNDELEKIVATGAMDEDYIIRTAREKLGYAFPDERVYQDLVGN